MRLSGLKIIGTVAARVPQLIGTSLVGMIRLRTSRRKAMDAFYRAMVEHGVPEPLARELQAVYPEFPIDDLGKLKFLK